MFIKDTREMKSPLFPLEIAFNGFKNWTMLRLNKIYYQAELLND